VGIRLTDSSLTVSDCLLADNSWVGIGAVGASVLTLDGTVIRGTIPRPEADPTTALLVTPGTRAELSRCALVGNTYTALVASGHGAVASVERTVFRDGVPQEKGSVAGRGGYGIVVNEGGSADVVESIALDNHAEGFGVTGADAGGKHATLHVARSVVRGIVDD